MEILEQEWTCYNLARKSTILLGNVKMLFYPSESRGLERVDLGKMDLQFIANEENQDRAQGGKNEARRMVPFVCRARKHVANAAADDRSDDAEHGCPEHRHMDVHHRFRDHPRDQPNQDVPD
jgi:hypothetical protein